ncbi:hypothetical protein VAA_03086 [Vibrio anguillarum 775]|nr:hypothetical protein VAA_03086 [Vibrio anguillarum 775]
MVFYLNNNKSHSLWENHFGEVSNTSSPEIIPPTMEITTLLPSVLAAKFMLMAEMIISIWGRSEPRYIPVQVTIRYRRGPAI